MNDYDPREAGLQSVRATYARYQREGRGHLWNPRNEGYRRLAAERDAALVSIVKRSAANRTGVKFLDVGCGTGHLAGLLKKELPSLMFSGVDLLPERIEIARTNEPWATFTVGSADRLQDPDGTFDIASAITLFSSIPSPSIEESVAREIERILRPGGWLVWYDVRYRNPWNQAVHPVTHGRLRELFPGWEVELWSLGVPAPFARRMGRLARFLYPLAAELAPLRSHLVGRLRRPDIHPSE